MAEQLSPFATRLTTRTSRGLRYIAMRRAVSTAEVARQVLDAHVEGWRDPATGAGIPSHALTAVERSEA